MWRSVCVCVYQCMHVCLCVFVSVQNIQCLFFFCLLSVIIFSNYSTQSAISPFLSLSSLISSLCHISSPHSTLSPYLPPFPLLTWPFFLRYSLNRLSSPHYYSLYRSEGDYEQYSHLSYWWICCMYEQHNRCEYVLVIFPILQGITDECLVLWFKLSAIFVERNWLWQ